MGIIEGTLRSWNLDINPGAQLFHVETYAEMVAAITAAVADQGDIIVLDDGLLSVTATLTFNKSGLTVIQEGLGVNPIVRGEKSTIWAAASYTTGPVATVTAPTTFIGIGFASRYSGGEAVLVNGEGGSFTGGWCKFLNCRFPRWVAEGHAIRFSAGAYNLVKECWFEGAFNPAIEFGPSASNNPTDNVIEKNHFRDCTYAIGHSAGTPHHFLYKGNRVIDGKLFNAGGFAADGLICDNWLETATDTGSYNAAVATNQALGIQFSGNHYSE